MSSHGEFLELLRLEAASLLAPAEQARLAAHVAGCPACAREQERWQELRQALHSFGAEEPSAILVARTRALARARLEELAERRWNRLVLWGLIAYGWALWIVVLPMLPSGVSRLTVWLGLPWPVTTFLLFLSWWSFTWVIGVAALPLLRWRKHVAEERCV